MKDIFSKQIAREDGLRALSSDIFWFDVTLFSDALNTVYCFPGSYKTENGKTCYMMYV